MIVCKKTMPGNRNNPHDDAEPRLKRARHKSPPHDPPQHYYYAPEGIPGTLHRIPYTPNFGSSSSGGPAGPPPATPSGSAGPAHGHTNDHQPDTPAFVGGSTGSWSGWHHHDGHHHNHHHRDHHYDAPTRGHHHDHHHHAGSYYDHPHHDHHQHRPADQWAIVQPDPQHEAWQHEVWHDNINNVDETDQHWRWLHDENRWSWGKWYRGSWSRPDGSPLFDSWAWVEELN